MSKIKSKADNPAPNEDGIDRRDFLECMAWAGMGMLWTISGGVLSSLSFAQVAAGASAPRGGLHFAQISDSHIGFSKPANPNVNATLQSAIAKINAMPSAPAFLLHTGDITHLAAADQFDTSEQLLKSAKTSQVFYVPGEHDVDRDEGKLYRERYGKDTKGDGWYSFNHSGIHFIGLVNVMKRETGGLGTLGREQLEWLEKDVKRLPRSAPLVVFAHIPLWNVYPDWGWGTEDGAQALSYLKPFGSVTVLNGHIHQTMQKVEGNVMFHTAASTAFPQPKPGTADAPGPMKVEPGQLRGLLGVTNVTYLPGKHSLAVVDASLAEGADDKG